MNTFAFKRKRAVRKSRRNHPSQFSYRGPEVKDQQTKIHSILHSTGAQAQLTVGQPNDKYEREADSVSDQVMSMSDPSLQRQPVNEEEEETIQSKPMADHISPLVQRQEEPTEEEEESVQAKENQAMGESTPSIAPSSVESGINSIRGNGQPLPVSTRRFLEPRFGANFKEVRVHTDSNANNLTRRINAKAFTIGKDVVFGSGQYSPHTEAGRRLLAHELTHVVQQNNDGRVKRKLDLVHVSTQTNRLLVIQRTECLDIPDKKNPYTFNFVVRNGFTDTKMLPSSRRYIGKIRGTGLNGPQPGEYFNFQLRRCLNQVRGRGNLLYPAIKVPKNNKYHLFVFTNSIRRSHGLYGQISIKGNQYTRGSGIIVPWSF